jgi:hypothetical protein
LLVENVIIFYKMKEILVVLLLFCNVVLINAQELNAQVVVNFDRVTAVNTQIFKTFENSVREFLVNTKWTETEYEIGEKIQCSFFINISAFESNNFTATLQVMSSRPIFNSGYASPILNMNDKDFSFQYIEFQPLFYNPNSFDSNLTAVLAYYVNIILGFDAESYVKKSGTKYFEQAQNITNFAQSSGSTGWRQSDGFNNRFYLIQDLMSNTFDPIKEAFNTYHVDGLDKMHLDTKMGKESVKKAIIDMSKIMGARPNSFLARIFFDAKTDEIGQIFSGGPNVNITDMKNVLYRASPLNASTWDLLK